MIGYAFWISQRISQRVIKVAQGAKEIAQGNLASEKLVVDSQDELGQLAQDFNAKKENLTQLVKGRY